MTGRLTIVLGGQKSGKSGFAARRATASGRPVTVVTPAVIRDDEFKARVERHRRDRPAEWTTLETFDLGTAVKQAALETGGSFLIVDALDTWLAERMESSGVFVGDNAPNDDLRADTERAVLDEIRQFADAVAASACDVLMIAGQPGLGAHAVGAGARFYVDLHGLCIQALSDAADEVLFIAGGRPMRLEPDSEIHGDHAGPLSSPKPSQQSDLREHGDTQVPDGAIDLAVNVQPGPPAWLAKKLAAEVESLAAYPNDRDACAAAAARHGRPATECLVVNGAAEAFWLLAQVLRPRRAVCVQPSFTEPEAALRASGVPVTRVFRSLDDGWTLHPGNVPDDADLVVLGRPDNPTGAIDPVLVIEQLTRPGRVVVVDEAFAEFLGDADGLAARRDLPGLVSVRSLTKLWGLAGLRVGYLVGPAELVARLRTARQPWSSNALALTALSMLVDDGTEAERRVRAGDVDQARADLIDTLRSIPGLDVWDSQANFLLIRGPEHGLRDRLLEHGFAARRADTFPGLDDRFIRIAVRDPVTNTQFATALHKIIPPS
jgi:histidinol-phosphate/aromatic aminotransferase/cobyric acid decarboxylase-like protein/adenosyl cobinamide kinase/adenosyl cobinamide phosphate guanylyltransferase